MDPQTSTPLPEPTSGPTSLIDQDSTDDDTSDEEDVLVVPEPEPEPEPPRPAMRPYKKLTAAQFERIHRDACSVGSANIGGMRIRGDKLVYRTYKFDPSKKSSAKSIQWLLMRETPGTKSRPPKVTGRQITASKASGMPVVVMCVVDRLDITPLGMDAYQEGDKVKIDYRVKFKAAGPGCPGFDTDVHRPLTKDLEMLIDACNEGLSNEIAHGIIAGTTKRGAKESSFQSHFENPKVDENPAKMKEYLDDFRETAANNTLRHYGKVNRDVKTGEIESIVSPSFNCRTLDMNFAVGLKPGSGEVLRAGDQRVYDRFVEWASEQPDKDEQMKHLNVMRDTILDSQLLTEKHQSFGLPRFSIGKRPITITDAMRLNTKGALVMLTLESLPLKETLIASALQYTNNFRITDICFIMEGPDLAAEMGSAVDNDALFADFGDDVDESGGAAPVAESSVPMWEADSAVVDVPMIPDAVMSEIAKVLQDTGTSDEAVDASGVPVAAKAGFLKEMYGDNPTPKPDATPKPDPATEARRAARKEKKAKRSATDTGDSAKREKKAKVVQTPQPK